MKVYDCITYFNEPLLFNLRLNILSKYVDKFIVIEAKHTHSGKNKKLNFDLEKHSGFEKKIIYKVIENEPSNILKIEKNDKPEEASKKKRMNSVRRIDQSYNAAIGCLSDADPNDIFILSDSDEIPNLENIKFNEINNKILMFKQKLFYYKFNLYYDLLPWFGSRACSIKNLISPKWLRYTKPKKYSLWRFDIMFSKTKYNKVKIIENGGWHFSNLKKPDEIKEKLFNFGHHNEIEDSDIDIEKIKSMVNQKKIFHDHFVDKSEEKYKTEGYQLKKIDLSKLPNYLIHNIEKYQEWFDN